MAPFSKPETVLKQAEGLVSVGQTHAALQSLTEMFSSKRIPFHAFSLCVDMRKGRTAKEGLMQYKNIAQNTSVQSIEVVITRFVALADGKAVDVDDLEASETPESILLGAVSGDQNKDRTDRALVTPWLKFLWESYRTALETLKNNARLEVIYQTIAQQAFKFCLTHNRKVEFRRLCETLRLHLANHHLDTRFAQLNTSVELELWQEAFRSVEDVHNLLTMAKKAPRPAMMAGYYEKLTRIFLDERECAMVCANNGANGKSPEELQRLAARCSSALWPCPSLPAPSSTSTSSNSPDARLTALLGLATPPTRASLLAFCAPHSSSASSILPPNTNAAHQSILQLAPSAIQQLYTILEVSFDPLSLCASVAPLLSSLRLSEEWKVYVPLLERAVLSRLMAQLAQVYESVGVGFVGGLVEPLRVAAEAAAAAAATANGDAAAPTEGEDKTAPTSAKSPFSAPQIESYIMGCARRGELAVRVDHAAGGFRGVVGDDSAASSSSNVLNANGEYGGRGSETPIQPSVAELVRTRLGSVARCLHASVGVIGAAAPAGETRTTEEQNEQFKTLVAAVHAERKSLLLRRALVARRRELLSELSVRREKEEAVRRADASRREKEEEEKRKKEEVRRRELVRVEKIKVCWGFFFFFVFGTARLRWRHKSVIC
ncbi:hypothetical protein C8J57DRAFT_1400296 [Mycena rebaudengoi]|nr:hypothetical protein C8J57DRAFT_1400296 [Mycena rebaudengoi]